MDTRRTGLGLDLPIRRGNEGYFETNTRSLDQVRANLENVLLTRRGERLLRPDFGSRLYEFVFEPNASRLNKRVRDEIERVVERFIPYVNILDIDIERDDSLAAVLINISFETEFSAFRESQNLQLWMQQEQL